MALSRLPFRAWLLVLLLAALGVSLINPTSWRDMAFEHIPTAVVLGLLVWYGRTRPLSDASYVLLFVFMLLHVLGAHYLYSHVPYDRWATAVFGRDVTTTFGLSRNHYDRVVHFMWGVLIVAPFADMGVRFAGIRRGFWAAVFGVGLAGLGGCLYEIIEWLLTLLVSPEAAEDYNGQQGDMFDAQKDMTLNVIGSVISGVWVVVAARKHGGSRA